MHWLLQEHIIWQFQPVLWRALSPAVFLLAMDALLFGFSNTILSTLDRWIDYVRIDPIRGSDSLLFSISISMDFGFYGYHLAFTGVGGLNRVGWRRGGPTGRGLVPEWEFLRIADCKRSMDVRIPSIHGSERGRILH